jgi:MFS family permease
VIAIAFLTAIAGGILSVVASLYLTELYHVSNFEGGRGMLIFFALAPLGLIVGFIIGLVVALRSRDNGFGGFAKAQGVAVELRLDSVRLFQAFSISRPIIHPNWMANRSRSSSSLKFRRP